MPEIRNAIAKQLNKPNLDLDILKQDIIEAISKKSKSPAAESQAETMSKALENPISETISAITSADTEDTPEIRQQRITDIIDHEIVARVIRTTTQSIERDIDNERLENDSAEKIKLFADSAKKITAQLEKHSAEIDDSTNIISSLQSAVGKIPQAELLKLINSTAFQSFENKVKEYQEAVQTFRAKLETQQIANYRCILDTFKPQYDDIHKKIYDMPNNLAIKIETTKNAITAFKKSLSMPTLFA